MRLFLKKVLYVSLKNRIASSKIIHSGTTLVDLLSMGFRGELSDSLGVIRLE